MVNKIKSLNWENILVYTIITLSICCTIWFLYATHISPERELMHTINTYSDAQERKMSLGCYMLFAHAQSSFNTVLALRFVLLTAGMLISSIGGLFVVKGVKTDFHLDADDAKRKINFEASSPGVIMVLLGVIAMIYALHKEQTSTFNLQDICLRKNETVIQNNN